MKESDLTLRVKKDLELYCKSVQIPLFWHKFDDFPAMSIRMALEKMLCQRCRPMIAKTGLGRFGARKRPFDVFSIINGAPVAIEFKMHTSNRAFPLDAVKPHQDGALFDVDLARGIGLVAIGNQFKTNRPELFSDGQKYRGLVTRLIVLTWPTWRRLRRTLEGNRKSVPLNILLDAATGHDGVVLYRTNTVNGRAWECWKLVNFVTEVNVARLMPTEQRAVVR